MTEGDPNDLTFPSNEIAASSVPVAHEGDEGSRHLLLIFDEHEVGQQLHSGETSITPGDSNAPKVTPRSGSSRHFTSNRAATKTLDYYFPNVRQCNTNDSHGMEDSNPEIYRIDSHSVIDLESRNLTPWSQQQQGAPDLSRQSNAVAVSGPCLKRKTSSSAVWSHFKKSEVKGESQCNYCQAKLKSLNATNLKRHLKSCNPTASEGVEQKDDKSLRSVQEPKQRKLEFGKSYPGNHPKQMALRKKLALLYGCTSVTANAMQTEEFEQCFRAIDPRVKIPDKKTIRKDFQERLASSRTKVKEMLQNVQRITVSSDIWTKKGNRSSFLGVTATFFYPPLKQKVNVILGVQKFTSVTHKATDIIREMRRVLAMFQIAPKQVWRAITDGASNMISSHRMDKRIFCPNDDQPGGSGNKSDEDSGDSSDEEESPAELDVRDESHVISQDALFENPMDMNPAFRRLTCFIHTVLVCLKTFELNSELKAVIDRVKFLVGKFSKSPKLMGDLVAEAGVRLVSFCEIRWNYVYLVTVRLLRVEAEISLVLTRHGKLNYIPSEEDWDNIRRMVGFLKPFHEYTCMVSKEKEAVSSEVIVAILQIYNHLDKYDSVPLFREAAQNIKESLKRKFSTWFHDTNNDFEGTYIIGALLDPRFRLVVPSPQRALAKTYLLNEFALTNTETSSSNAADNEQQAEIPAFDPTSTFPLVQEMKEALRTLESRSNNTSLKAFEAEWDKYLSNESFDKLPEKKKQLRVLMLDMFAAGAETTRTTLGYSFLLLALHPEVQEKLFEEIKRVVGLSRHLALSDKPEMPYFEATIMEVQRYASLAGRIPHFAHKEVEFNGYTIPKGATVIGNLYSASRDVKAWGDPDNFRPERFLSPDGKTVVRNEAFLAFSVGKRVCLAETLAKDELFLFMGNLFQAFEVKTVEGEPKPKFETFASIILVPKPHRLVLVQRPSS